MKNILITGENSYIGTNFERWLNENNDELVINTIDMRNKNWNKFDFSKFNVVFHVAGIAHIKESKSNKKLYFDINEILAVETAKKAKKEGVNHFIFLSTMSVFGSKSKIINRETIPKPNSYYGKSKFAAEQKIMRLSDDKFKVLIIRPPMVYGIDSPGNFQHLVKFAKRTPIYPDFNNKRSMIYVDNLSIKINKYINDSVEGIVHPQNNEFSSTLEIINQIRKKYGLKDRKCKLINLPVKIAMIFSNKMRKIFGDLIYEKEEYDKDLIPLKETINLY